VEENTVTDVTSNYGHIHPVWPMGALEMVKGSHDQKIAADRRVLQLSTSAISLSAGNLNAQLRVFKCQGTFNAFIDHQNLETLYS
jgi:hypothetical protein